MSNGPRTRCVATWYVAGPCRECRKQVGPAHLVEESGGDSAEGRTGVYCPNCCPVCGAREMADEEIANYPELGVATDPANVVDFNDIPF